MLRQLLVTVAIVSAIGFSVPTPSTAAECNGRCFFDEAGCGLRCGFGLFPTGNYCINYCVYCVENPCFPRSIFLEFGPEGSDDAQSVVACTPEVAPETRESAIVQVQVLEPRT